MFYEGTIIGSNHIDLYLSALDKDKDSLAVTTLNVGPLDKLNRRTRQQIAGFCTAPPSSTVTGRFLGFGSVRCE